MLGIGALCIVLLLGGCGGGDNPTAPPSPGNPGNTGDVTPAACITTHCAPVP